MIDHIHELVKNATHIVIIQADNPDGDSLGSALALEAILGDLDKQASLYCAVDMPGYLRYLEGWDRVTNTIPESFDVSIVVDASTNTLLEKLLTSRYKQLITSKPCIVLDHHETVENEISFAQVVLNDISVSSTGELIYNIAHELNWPLNPKTSGTCITAAILNDTQGLTNGLTKPSTYRIIADLVDLGVDRPKLEEKRRELSKMPVEILKYKALLIERTEFFVDGMLAIVGVPHNEIIEYSALYNPAPLIQADLLQTLNVGIAIVLKHYNDGKILGAVRCNPGYGIGAQLAEHFGGGGHAYASGFKIQGGKPFNEVKSECISYTQHLIDTLEQEKSHETTQYTYTTN